MFGELDTLEKQLAGLPLLEIFEDPSITDLLFMGHERFFVERQGVLEPREPPFLEEKSYQAFLERLIVPTGRRQDARYPFLDGALADGSRFHLVFPPVSREGAILSIRKLRRASTLTLDDFVEEEHRHVIETIKAHAALGDNILVSGGTGVGKTTFLGLLMDALSPAIRWVVIEECQEIVTFTPHSVRLQGRPATADGVGEITLRMLLKNALRMRPDRLVLGECRGGEAFDLLQALMSGHAGSLGTIHASNAWGALHRLESLVGLAGTLLSPESVRLWISQSIRWVVHLEHRSGKRRLTELIRVEGLESMRYRVLPWFRIEKQDRNC